MLIIVEGPDGTGKTTLANRLRDHLGKRVAKVIHRGPPTTDSLLTEYALPLTDYVPGAGRHVICDRWHLGELVYPKLVNRPSLATSVTYHYLELFLASRGALLVYLEVDPEETARRIIERGLTVGDSVDPAFVRRQRYDFEAAASGAKITSLCVGESIPFTQAIDSIVHLADHAERTVTPLAAHPTYVGMPRPSVLMLGDVRGPSNPGYATAFAPLPSTSGDYLWSALESAPLPSHMAGAGYGAANANEGDARDLWLRLGQPPTVALGNNALRGAISAGFDRSELGVVTHPQYWRRFHHRYSREYAEVLSYAALASAELRPWRPGKPGPSLPVRSLAVSPPAAVSGGVLGVDVSLAELPTVVK